MEQVLESDNIMCVIISCHLKPEKDMKNSGAKIVEMSEEAKKITEIQDPLD